jgi:hypothetical protein
LRHGKKQVTRSSIQSELIVIVGKSHPVELGKNEEGFFFTPILISDTLKT